MWPLPKNLFDVRIAEDNQTCNSEDMNLALSDLRKHVDLKYQFLVYHVWNRAVCLEYITMDKMAADTFTENLGAQKLKIFLCMTKKVCTNQGIPRS